MPEDTTDQAVVPAEATQADDTPDWTASPAVEVEAGDADLDLNPDEESPELEAEYGAPALAAVNAVLNGINAYALDAQTLSDVPEPLRPFVETAAGAIANYATGAYQRGVAVGERMAVLNELFNEDRDAFEAEIAQNADDGAAFYQWKAEIAQKAGTNDEAAQAMRAKIGKTFADLAQHADARARVEEQARAEGLFAHKDNWDTDLRRLERLVDREIGRIDAAAASGRSSDRAANAARVNSLPKPDVGSSAPRPLNNRYASMSVEELRLLPDDEFSRAAAARVAAAS